MKARTVTLKAFVHAKAQDAWPEKDEVAVDGYKLLVWPFSEVLGGHLVCPCTVTVELPDTWNPVASEVANLEAEKEKLAQDYHESVYKINTRISKLQALEYTAPNKEVNHG